MNVVRQAGALLLAALVTSRGLFAQGAVDSPAADSTVVDLRGAPAITPADQLKVLLHPVEIRYVQQESVLLPATGSIKGLYVNEIGRASCRERVQNCVERLALR